MQPERRFYNSITAEALCEAGHFVIYGQTLQVFSLTHSALLTQLECAAWTQPVFTELDLLHAAQICSGNFHTIPTPAEAAEILETWDFAAQAEIWRTYCATCAAAPHPKTDTNTLGTKLSVPDEQITAAFLHLHSNLTDREIWHGCYGKIIWLTAALAEQLSGKSSITTEQDLAAIAHAESEEGQRESEEARELFLAIEARYAADLAACQSEAERDYARRAYKARLRDFAKLDPETLEVRK
tara:strand:- start:2014 stop:2736 length:723 start_codon:yes stop_codon:yes gene_type:complete